MNSSSTLIEKEEKKTNKKYIGMKRVEAFIIAEKQIPYYPL
jgi:hypothetical protein